MEIDTETVIEKSEGTFFVCTGRCDGILTKWITNSKWDGNLSLSFEDGKMMYKDSKGQRVKVLEADEEGFNAW